MKIFRVFTDNIIQGECVEALVVAENEDDVRKHLVHEGDYFYYYLSDDELPEFGFSDEQGEIHIVEIDLSCEHVETVRIEGFC